MATFSLLVTKPPYDSEHALKAVRFCENLLRSGHLVDHVFFYQGGVHNANCLITPPSDEVNLYRSWTQLLCLHPTLKLLVCVTAATKRGLVDSTYATEIGLPQFTIQAPFEQAGLGDFFTRVHECEQLVQF